MGIVGGAAFLLSQNFLLKKAFAEAPKTGGRPKKNIKGAYDLVVANGQDPYQNTVKAIDAMGGMEKFVARGSTVVVKPNMAWDRSSEYGANTDPRVVAAIVGMCYKAGAKRVNVFDNPCNDAKRVYVNTGIAKAAKDAGAYVYFVDEWNTVKATFSYKSPMEGWPVYRDAVVCDTFINVPVLKHHSLTGLTLSMKNLMGICAGNRGLMHVGIHEKLVDITDYISPELTVIDATRILTRNGPVGGNLDDVVQVNKVIVATDPTLADTYAAVLANKSPLDIPYIAHAIRRGFGSADLKGAKMHTIAL